MSAGASKFLVFDCDGTLVDSAGLIVACMKVAFDEQNLPEPEDRAVHSIVGLSLTGAIGRLVDDMGLPLGLEDIQVLGEKYKQAFARLKLDPAYEQPLYPHIRDCLEQAKGQGMLVGIATGKSRRGLESILDLHDLRELVDDSITADEAHSKPHPDMLHQITLRNGVMPRDTAMIGDTSFDIEMAVAADCLPVGVDWGNHEAAHLVQCGAKVVLEDARHLLPWLADNWT